MFELDGVLARDSIAVGKLPLCQLRLINDRQFPWFILVPERIGITEIHELSVPDRQQLMAESCLLAEAMETIFAPDKLNIAAIGNKVRQLHYHHIARFESDVVWPEPIWGKRAPIAYDEKELANLLQKVREKLSLA